MPTVYWDGEVVTWDGEEVYWDSPDPAPTDDDPWVPTESPLPVYRVGVVTGTSAEPTSAETVAVIPGARVDFIEARLNAPGSFSITFPKDAPQLDELVTGDRWVLGDPQIVVWRDGQIVARGFPDEPTEDPIAGTVTFLCMDPIEHLNRQVVGDAERVNYADHDNWNVSSGTITLTMVDGDDVGFDVGSTAQVLKIEADTAGQVSDVFAMPTSETLRHSYRVACWVRILEGNGNVSIGGTAVYDGGGPGNVVPWGGDFDGEVTSGRWTRFESESIGVSPDRDVEIVPKVNVIAGTAVLIASAASEGSGVVRINRNDGESVPAGGDIGTLVGTLLQWPISHLGVPVRRKSYTVGRTLVDGYLVPHAEHRTVWQAIDEWLHEVDVRYVPWLNRFESGPASVIGGQRWAMTVGPLAEGGHYGGKVRVQYASGQDITHQAIVLGNSGSYTRDEYASEAPESGPVWQTVVNAADDVLPPEFPRVAADHVRTDPEPVLTLDLFAPPLGRTPGDWIARGVWVGERFECRTDLGPKKDSATRRITRMRLVPPEGDRLEVECVDA